MSFMRKTETITISSNIPDHVDSQALVSALHDPVRMIRLNPLVKDSGPAAEDDKTVQDARKSEPEYEGAQWYYALEQVRFVGNVLSYCAFKHREDGYDVVVHAPAGLILNGKIRVETSNSGHGRVLKEVTTMTLNAILLAVFVKPNFEKAHYAIHRDLLQQVGAATKDAAATNQGTMENPSPAP